MCTSFNSPTSKIWRFTVNRFAKAFYQTQRLDSITLIFELVQCTILTLVSLLILQHISVTYYQTNMNTEPLSINLWLTQHTQRSFWNQCTAKDKYYFSLVYQHCGKVWCICPKQISHYRPITTTSQDYFSINSEV